MSAQDLVLVKSQTEHFKLLVKVRAAEEPLHCRLTSSGALNVTAREKAAADHKDSHTPWPHDILQKCNLSSATGICKQLMTFKRAITRVKILVFLIHPKE